MCAVDAEDWVTLRLFPSSELAHVLKSRLEDEGIECRLENEHFHHLYGGAVADVGLQVRAADLPHARRVLASGGD